MIEPANQGGSSSFPSPSVAAAYLVRNHHGQYGPAYDLNCSTKVGIGRAGDNKIVVRDDSSSRHHAEVFCTGDHWMIRDLGSTNGTIVNGKRILDETSLGFGDRVVVGLCEFVFVAELEDLEKSGRSVPAPVEAEIKVRHRQDQTLHDGRAFGLNQGQEFHNLYKLAVGIGLASNPQELATAVLRTLLETTNADSGAIYRLCDVGEWESLASYAPPRKTFRSIPSRLMEIVRKERKAILVEDRPSHIAIPGFGGSNVVCAPVLCQDDLIAIVQIYTDNPLNCLTREDLDIVVAVAEQLGPVSKTIERNVCLQRENERLRDMLGVETELVGRSNPMLAVLRQISLVAGTNATVLIRGESGVGKELVARAIHLASQRKDGPFICVPCVSADEAHLERELFGSERATPEGRTEEQQGKLELADAGTLFLDEIGELSPASQPKLMRILDGYPCERIGGTKPISSQARIIAATNRDLEAAIADRSFRRDLYFRLQVVEIRVPPLRERKEDIPLLAMFYVRRFARAMSRKAEGFSLEAIAKLTSYDWPGNVRELRNVLERSVVLSDRAILEPGDIRITEPTRHHSGAEPEYQMLSLEQLEVRHISRTLEHTGWNKSQSAQILGIERSTLDRKIKRYGILDASKANATDPSNSG